MTSWMSRLRPARSASPRVQRVLLAIAFVAFVAMGWLAIANFPDEPEPEPRWGLLVLVGMLGPLVTVFLNGLEYRQQGRLVDRAVPIGDAIRVSVLGTAANLAPVPGSVLVRTSALVSEQTGVKRAAATTATVGVAWLGASAFAAGVLQPVADRVLLGVLLVVAGVALLAATYVFVRRAAPADGTNAVFAAIVLVELGTVIVGGLRLLGIIAGLGLDVTLAQALGLTLAGVIASATGIFPAGIGIREALVGLISPALGLEPAVAVAAAAADRLAGLLVLAVLTAVIVARRDRTGKAS